MLQKRLNILFNGHEVPPVPRAARSPRRRLPCRKKIGDYQMCAFDLLATVAGKLLEGESTPSATELLTGEDESALVKFFLKTEKVAEENPEQVNLSHKEGRGRILFVSDTNPQAPEETHDIKEVSNVQNDASSAFASAVTTCDGPEMLGSASKLVNDEGRIEYGNLSKVKVGQYHSATSLYSLDVESKNCMKIEPQMIGKDPSSAGDVTCYKI
nr:PREDICTED: telomere repeat-binding protein 5-like isoform X1 [Daucus carota subsp. sativus]